MVIAKVEWRVQRGPTDSALLETYIRDPSRRGEFVAGVHCNQHGVAVRTEGCTEDAAILILRKSITSYEEAVL